MAGGDVFIFVIDFFPAELTIWINACIPISSCASQSAMRHCCMLGLCPAAQIPAHANTCPHTQKRLSCRARILYILDLESAATVVVVYLNDK